MSLCLVILLYSAVLKRGEVKVCDSGVRGPQRWVCLVPDPGLILGLNGGQVGLDDPLC